MNLGSVHSPLPVDQVVTLFNTEISQKFANWRENEISQY